jgi:hypothetical protein
MFWEITSSPFECPPKKKLLSQIVTNKLNFKYSLRHKTCQFCVAKAKLAMANEMKSIKRIFNKDLWQLN